MSQINQSEKGEKMGGKTLFYKGVEYRINYGKINYLIPSEIFTAGLSTVEIGVLTYLLCLPKQWKLSITHLSEQLKMSPNTIRKHLQSIFDNEKVRAILKAEKFTIPTYDLEDGIYQLECEANQEALEMWSSSTAKDVSIENKREVLVLQNNRQNYLLNLCFTAGNNLAKKREVSQEKPSVKTRKNCVKSSAKNEQEKCANFAHYNKEILKKSLKDNNSYKRTRKQKELIDFIPQGIFTQEEQEHIKFWLAYKQESKKAKLKPSQIDFQIKKIQRLKQEGADIVASIAASLDMGWQGLFYREKREIKPRSHATPPPRDCKPKPPSANKELVHKEILRALLLQGLSVSEIVSRTSFEGIEVKGRKIAKEAGTLRYV